MLRVRKRGAAMSKKPQVVTAGNEVKEQLQNIVNRRKSEQRLVERARIILKCLEGMPLEDIAKQVGVSKVTVSKWKSRFLSDGFQGCSICPDPVERQATRNKMSNESSIR